MIDRGIYIKKESDLRALDQSQYDVIDETF